MRSAKIGSRTVLTELCDSASFEHYLSYASLTILSLLLNVLWEHVAGRREQHVLGLVDLIRLLLLTPNLIGRIVLRRS